MSTTTKRWLGGAAATALIALEAAMSFAQPAVYPAKGQSPQQQQLDQGECQTWAANQAAATDRAFAACMEGRGYTVK